jgi:hypothetical protein
MVVTVQTWNPAETDGRLARAESFELANFLFFKVASVIVLGKC